MLSEKGKQCTRILKGRKRKTLHVEGHVGTRVENFFDIYLNTAMLKSQRKY